MRLTVHLRPNSRRPGIEPLPDGTLRVSVSAPPVEGRANAALIAVLADYLDRPRSHIRIIRGARSRTKIVEVTD